MMKQVTCAGHEARGSIVHLGHGDRTAAAAQQQSLTVATCPTGKVTLVQHAPSSPNHHKPRAISVYLPHSLIQNGKAAH
jgi:hypothetical protein